MKVPSRPDRRRGIARDATRSGVRVWVVVLASILAWWAPATDAFDLQGHRGARGLAPENTLAGFARALDLGVTTLETDIAITKDDVVVISHDPDLHPALVRRPNGIWLTERGPAIRSLTLAELKTYDIGRVNPASAYARQWPLQHARDGERFPTLAELYALARSRESAVRFNLETKITPTSGDSVPDPEAFVRIALAQIRAAHATGRTTLQSFDWRTLVTAKRLAPELPTSCLTVEQQNFNTVKSDASGRSPWHAGLALADHDGSLPKLVRAAGCGTWSAHHESLTRERVREAQSLGLKVLAWTVNEIADIARAVDLGVDGLITDYPDRAKRVLTERGIALD